MERISSSRSEKIKTVQALLCGALTPDGLLQKMRDELGFSKKKLARMNFGSGTEGLFITALSDRHPEIKATWETEFHELINNRPEEVDTVDQYRKYINDFANDFNSRMIEKYGKA